MHRKNDNVKGLVACMDNLVQLYVQTGDIERAHEAAKNVLDRVRKGHDMEALQHAAMNMGTTLIALITLP